jgi:carbonic anhydrase
MADLTNRSGNGRGPSRKTSLSATLAQKKLEHGNELFSRLITAMKAGKPLGSAPPIGQTEFGSGSEDGECAAQSPYAAILSCSDARAPTEMILQQGINDLFVVRVAGNVLGRECMGSLSYAANHFPKSLKVMAVLGHANCGAVAAAVDAYLDPGKYLDVAGNYPLRTIIDQIIVCVRTADVGLQKLHGPAVMAQPEYRDTLLEVSVSINAAWNAFSLREELIGRLRCNMKIVFGVYDLRSHRLGLMPSTEALPLRKGFFETPSGVREFGDLVLELCGAAAVSRTTGVTLRGRSAAGS